jgi:hypothetical protein
LHLGCGYGWWKLTGASVSVLENLSVLSHAFLMFGWWKLTGASGSAVENLHFN